MKMGTINLKNIFTEIISACSFKKKFDEATGIHCNGEKIFFVNVRLIQSEEETINQWKVVDTAEVSLVSNNQLSERSRQILIEFDALDEDIPESLEVENIRELIAKKAVELFRIKNWNVNAVALCLNTEDVITEIEDLSNIPENKIPNTVHYQMAVTGNFEADTYLSAFMKIEFGVWMEGISKTEAFRWTQAFKENGINLLAFTAMPEEVEKVDGIDLNNLQENFLNVGGIKALFAVKNLIYKTKTNFLTDRTIDLSGWNFAKITITLFLTMSLIIILISTVDFWNYRQAKKHFEYEQEKLALLESDKRKEEFIKKNLEELKDKNQILSNLSKDLFTWRALLIHLGTVKVKDVWLREVHTLDDNRIEIKGEAMDYESMADYVKNLENDHDIFKTVVVKSSEIREDNNHKRQIVQFVIVLELL